MYTENALLFPRSVIPALRGIRGQQWDALIDHIMPLAETHEDTLAFMLMMINLNGCLLCETDSYRAMRGCAACAQQTVRRYKGTDDDLIGLYESSRLQVRAYAQKGTPIAQMIESDFIPVHTLPIIT